MINVVTMFASQSKQEALELDLARNDIRLAAPDFENADEFMRAFEEFNINIDAAVISDKTLSEVNKKDFFESIRFSEANLRIIIVFEGYRNQYTAEQILEYKEVFHVDDIIYEGGGMECGYMAQVIKRGYIYDYDINVYDEDDEKAEVKSEQPKCISIGIMGLTHGCGVTNMVVSSASYIALTEDIPVKAVDFSGSGNLRFAKGKKVTYIVHSGIDTDRLKRTSRAIVYDFGTPFDISSKGKLLSTVDSWDASRMKLFCDCDLKICMCYADSWHIGKLKYLLNDRQWKRSIDNSYLFVFDVVSDKLRTGHSKINIYGRNDSSISERLTMLFAGKEGG